MATSLWAPSSSTGANPVGKARTVGRDGTITDGGGTIEVCETFEAM